MRNTLRNTLLKALWMILAICLVQAAQATQAAPGGQKVLVLPFQAAAGPEMPNASVDIPRQIISQLNGQGMQTVPVESA
ncbi:MAG: hypothetical protein K6F46_04205, partial [Desulfovibrio sp.]|nr:hypothetical protein [Desulfovibrio sp.]